VVIRFTSPDVPEVLVISCHCTEALISQSSLLTHLYPVLVLTEVWYIVIKLWAEILLSF